MPIFEYSCDSCGRRFSALVGVVANPKPTACPRCGSQSLSKQVSRFARLRSEDEALENLTDESQFGDIENDPKAMRKWVKEMSAAMDEDMEDDFEAALEEEIEGGGEGGKADADTVY